MAVTKLATTQYTLYSTPEREGGRGKGYNAQPKNSYRLALLFIPTCLTKQESNVML